MKQKMPKAELLVEKLTSNQMNHVASSQDEIPPELEIFRQMENMSVLDILAMASPEIEKALKSPHSEKTIAALAGLFSGFDIDMGITVPKWAKAASQKALQAIGVDFVRDSLNADIGAIGKMVEFVSLTMTNNSPALGEQICQNAVKFFKNRLGELSAEELKKYADGQLAVPKIIKKTKNPSERAIIFICIAVAWQEVEKHGSHANTRQWLLDNKIISPYTDRAETSKFFREIKLPKGKSGRPRKIRTAPKTKNPVFRKKS